jgi:hypothetical protein
LEFGAMKRFCLAVLAFACATVAFGAVPPKPAPDLTPKYHIGTNSGCTTCGTSTVTEFPKASEPEVVPVLTADEARTKAASMRAAHEAAMPDRLAPTVKNLDRLISQEASVGHFSASALLPEWLHGTEVTYIEKRLRLRGYEAHTVGIHSAYGRVSSRTMFIEWTPVTTER